jgi:filamentous hemagglutinin
VIAAELEAQGYKIIYGAGWCEEYIPGGGPGTQGGTFVDITAVDPVTGKILRVQTVDTLADGVTPTPREQEAAARIRQAYPNDELILIPKRKMP